MDDNSYYIGYAAAIERFAQYFDKQSRDRNWSDNSYCTEVVDTIVDILDHMRKRVAIEIGRNNREFE